MRMRVPVREKEEWRCKGRTQKKELKEFSCNDIRSVVYLTDLIVIY